MPSQLTKMAASGQWEKFIEGNPRRDQVLCFMEMAPAAAREQAARWLLDDGPTDAALSAIRRLFPPPDCLGEAAFAMAEARRRKIISGLT